MYRVFNARETRVFPMWFIQYQQIDWLSLRNKQAAGCFTLISSAGPREKPHVILTTIYRFYTCGRFVNKAGLSRVTKMFGASIGATKITQRTQGEKSDKLRNFAYLSRLFQ